VSDLELKALSASSVIPTSELHGLVCGFAAGCPNRFSMSDFVQLAGSDLLSDALAVEAFVSAALDDFYSQGMTFLPLVPQDTELLNLRLAGLAQWCAGFLSGFGASVQAQHAELAPDLQEVLRDFASISAMDDEVDGDEQDESAYMEIFEYVRVAAMITTTLVAQATDDQVDPA